MISRKKNKKQIQNIYLNGYSGSQSLVNGGGDIFLGEGIDDSNSSKVLDAEKHPGLQIQKRFGPAESNIGFACENTNTGCSRWMEDNFKELYFGFIFGARHFSPSLVEKCGKMCTF